ncbi:MAG: Gfo/Idh/MocA family oxidoreductase [Clostridia bacterium]|nr:Gfo/Idh/MocA family oxidoreductase [Clostridia bacterium]
MKKYKVGLVGIGRGTAYGKLFARHPLTEVTALCDISESALERHGRDFGLADSSLYSKYEDFLGAGCDIIVLGTPMPYHAEQVVGAMDAGAHVLSEVTAASDLDGCVAIWRAVKRHPELKYMMAENCCYMAFARDWREIALSGRLGSIYYAEADYVHEIRNLIIDAVTGEEKWRVNRAPLHYCSHSLGPLLGMMPDDYIVRCTASGNRKTVLNHEGDGFIDMQVGLFQTKKGATIKVLRSSVAARKTSLCAYSVYGTKGVLETGRTEYNNTGLRYIEGEDDACVPVTISTTDPNAPEEAKLGGHGTSEYFLVRDFLDSIENDTTPPVDIVRALDMSVPGLIAHEAAKKGGVWMDIPLFWRE